MLEVKRLWNITGVMGNQVAQSRIMFVFTTVKKAYFGNKCRCLCTRLKFVRVKERKRITW
jgi:hypothetical protein